jgi:erythromycin esterase
MRVWIVGVMLVACGGERTPAVTPPPAAKPAAQVAVAPAQPPPTPVLWPELDLGFEHPDADQPHGWINQSSYEARVVAEPRHGGQHSLELRQAGSSEFGAATASAPADAVRGKHLKLRGWIKADAKGAAAMFLRIDGGGGAFDNMGDHKLTGTVDWTEVAVEVDVPEHAERVVFGPMLVGAGTAWFDDLRFEVSESARPRSIALEGTVVDAAGQPVAGAEVALVAPAGIRQHVVSDAGGRFHFDAETGRWAVSAQHAGMVGGFVDTAQFDNDARAIRIALAASGGVVIHGTLKPGKPMPDSHVAVSIVSEHEGDSFAAPVAADGTFELTLPRGDGYAAELIAGGVGRGSARRTGDRVEIAIPLAVLAPPPHEVVDWIAAHATALSTTEAGHGLDDIAPIARIVGKARIVALGEATHGSREFFQLKHRVLEYLVARQGFTVFAIEANQPECRAINDYVLHGTGDPKAALDGIYFWTWNTEEVLAMIEWMRTWNADPAHRNKVQFLGFDMQTSHVAHDSVAAYLGKVAPGAAASLLAPIEALGARNAIRDVPRLGADERKQLVDGLVAVARAFDDHHKAWVKLTTTAAFDDARHDVAILQQAAEMYRARAENSGFDIRDRSMAGNIQWILDHQPVGTRMVVWAHNGHIANRLGEFVNMGSQLRKQLKASYLNVGFAFSHGSFQAIVPAAHGKLDEIQLDVPPESHASTAFLRTGKPLLVLDLRAIPRSGTVHDWFVAPHPVRETGAVYSTESNMTVLQSFPELYDAMIFVASTTRARPLHPQ